MPLLFVTVSVFCNSLYAWVNGVAFMPNTKESLALSGAERANLYGDLAEKGVLPSPGRCIRALKTHPLMRHLFGGGADISVTEEEDIEIEM